MGCGESNSVMVENKKENIITPVQNYQKEENKIKQNPINQNIKKQQPEAQKK